MADPYEQFQAQAGSPNDLAIAGLLTIVFFVPRSKPKRVARTI